MKLKSRLGSHKNTPVGKSMLRNADQLTLCRGLLYHRYTLKYQVEEVKCLGYPRHTGGLPLTVAIEMQDIKARRGQRASSQIDTGGWVSIKMLIEQSKTADIVNSMEGGKKKPLWFQ